MTTKQTDGSTMRIHAPRTFDEVASRLRALPRFSDAPSGQDASAFFYEDWLSSLDAVRAVIVERGPFVRVSAHLFADAALPSESMLLGIQDQEGVADWIADNDSAADVEYAIGKDCAAVWLRAGSSIQLDVARSDGKALWYLRGTTDLDADGDRLDDAELRRCVLDAMGLEVDAWRFQPRKDHDDEDDE